MFTYSVLFSEFFIISDVFSFWSREHNLENSACLKKNHLATGSTSCKSRRFLQKLPGDSLCGSNLADCPMNCCKRDFSLQIISVAEAYFLSPGPIKCLFLLILLRTLTLHVVWPGQYCFFMYGERGSPVSIGKYFIFRGKAPLLFCPRYEVTLLYCILGVQSTSLFLYLEDKAAFFKIFWG